MSARASGPAGCAPGSSGGVLAGEPELLDRAYFARQVAGDHDLRAEVLALYRGQIEALASQVCGPPGQARDDAAHALKGASLAIGALALAGACERIERDGSGQAIEAARGVIEATRSLVTALIAGAR